MAQTCGLTRRGLLMLASGTGAQSWFRLYAGESEFWNKKDPSQWSSDEIERLKTKSPWAKSVNVALRQSGSGGNGGGGGCPARGRGGRGMARGSRGGRGGAAPIEYPAVVGWVRAKPIQEALKSPV